MGLVLAVILFEGVAAGRLYRSVLFMPYILSIPVVGIVFGYIFQLNGILNTFLRAVGLELLAADWLGSSRFALWTVMGVVVWKEFGFGVVLFLARLMSVEEELVRGRLPRGRRLADRCCSASRSPSWPP